MIAVMCLEDGLLLPFLGALQACVSVLLTICYGVAAQRLSLIHVATINDMSALGVKLFLPALIVVNLGKELHIGTALNYIPVLGECESSALMPSHTYLFHISNNSAWSFLYTIASIGLSRVLARLFRLPQWVAPATTFNNTSSLPLLLLQSFDSVGGLRLILREDQSTSDAIERAQSYFLVCAVVSKTIAYVVGPRMLHNGANTGDDLGSNEEQHPAQCEDERLTETTSLLPERAQNAKQAVRVRVCSWTKWLISLFPSQMREELMVPFGDPFAGVAIGCTLLGALLGLVPALHRVFFFRDENGGYLEAWLTQSVRNIGRLFTTLQIFLVGCKLGATFERRVAGNGAGGDSSRIPRRAITIIFLVRLVAWPAVSISLIYGLAKHTKLLGDDPILWFSMMLMPIGPPALMISGLAEVAQASEMEKIAIAKTLTVSMTKR